MALEIPLEVARRFLLGKQGLWPGRRWQGLAGTEAAMRAIEQLQLDPVVIVARAHDLVLHSRVIDYRQGDWAVVTYDERKFFDWGGWLAVRPMDELPHWRVVMRRELNEPNWIAFQAEHGAVIAEMRSVLKERGTVSNREFAPATRRRVDDYRGRKDSALALHFLWRIGDAMVFRRDGFERVYALTEKVAPAALVRESDPEVADDFLLTKFVATQGLTPLRNVGNSLKRTVSAAELTAWRQKKLAAGELFEVQVEGWRAVQVVLATDLPHFDDLLTGRTPATWTPAGSTTDEEATFLSPLDPVSARGRAMALFGFEYVWEIYKPAHKRRWGAYTLPVLWGDRLVARFDARLDRPTRTLVVNGLWLEDEALGAKEAFVEAAGRGMERFLCFLEARRVDVTAVSHRQLRSRFSLAS